MARKRRNFSAFSLAFLDIMSCGFGAVVLLFLIIKHNVDAHVPVSQSPTDLSSEVNLLEYEVLDGKKNLAKLRNTISDIDEELVDAQGLARRITDEITALEGLIDELIDNANVGKLDQLKARLKKLEIRKLQLTQDLKNTGEDARKFAGDGNRAYVTGLRLGGKRLLVLLDTSASMLDKTIINILRIRNMRDERQRNAPKWLQAMEIVDWLSARFPLDSQYQIYTFNTKTTSVLSATTGKWLDVRDKNLLNEAVKNLKQIVPENGTNLGKAFKAASDNCSLE